MKVLLINGSPRKNGNTHIALTEVAKHWKQMTYKQKSYPSGQKPCKVVLPATNAEN